LLIATGADVTTVTWPKRCVQPIQQSIAIVLGQDLGNEQTNSKTH